MCTRYTGSFIHFVNDVSTVIETLPRSAASTGLIIYASKDDKNHIHHLVVRRAAVAEHLEFFCSYHKYFKDGIPNLRSRDETDQFTVKPILWKDRNTAAIDANIT